MDGNYPCKSLSYLKLLAIYSSGKDDNHKNIRQITLDSNKTKVKRLPVKSVIYGQAFNTKFRKLFVLFIDVYNSLLQHII